MYFVKGTVDGDKFYKVLTDLYDEKPETRGLINYPGDIGTLPEKYYNGDDPGDNISEEEFKKLLSAVFFRETLFLPFLTVTEIASMHR